MDGQVEHMFDPEDRERLLEYAVLRDRLVLILRDTRLELHEIKPKADLYSRKLVWYVHVGEGVRQGFQALDVQHQSQIMSRVLLVVNNVIYILLINLSSRGFKRCTVVLKHRLISHPNQEVHDAKFFKDMDLVYTLRYIDPSIVDDLEKVNQFVYVLETQNLKASHIQQEAGQKQDKKLPTKNCSSEPMSISFTANFLHMVLHTKRTIQMLMVSTYSIEKMIHDKGMRVDDDQSIAKLTIEDRQKARCAQNRKVTGKTMSSFRNKSAAERSKEIEAVNRNIDLGEDSEQSIRQFSFFKRFEDSLLFDFKFEKQVVQANKTQRYNRKNPENQIRSKPVYQNTYITEVFSSNMHDKDKIVFVAEGGINPSLKIISIVPSGPKVVEMFTYKTIFKIDQYARLEKHEITRNFGYLRGKLVNVYQSRPDLKNHIEEIFLEEHKGEKRVKWFHLYERVTYFDYVIFFYCAEEDDALVAMTIRVSLEEFYKIRIDGAQDEARLRDDPENYPRKGRLVNMHRVSDAKREVIRQLSTKELGQLDVRIQPRPWEVMWSNLFSSMKFDAPRIKTLNWDIIEVQNKYSCTLVDLPPLPKFECEFTWVDQNWFFKQVRASTILKDGDHRIKFNVTVRDNDEPVITQIDEHLFRLRYKQKQNQETRERGMSPIVTEVEYRHRPSAALVDDQRADNRRDRQPVEVIDEERDVQPRIIENDDVPVEDNRRNVEPRKRRPIYSDMEDEWVEKSENRSNLDDSQNASVSDFKTFAGDISFQSQSDYNSNMEGTRRAGWGGSTKKRGRGRTDRSDLGNRERKDDREDHSRVKDNDFQLGVDQYFSTENTTNDEAPSFQATFKEPELIMEEVSFQNQTFGDGQLYPNEDHESQIMVNGYDDDESSKRSSDNRSEYQNHNSSNYNSRDDNYGSRGYRDNQGSRGGYSRGGNSYRGGYNDSSRSGRGGGRTRPRAALHPVSSGRNRNDEEYETKSSYTNTRESDSNWKGQSQSYKPRDSYDSDFTFGRQNETRDHEYYRDSMDDSWRHKKHAGKRIEHEQEDLYEVDGYSEADRSAYGQTNTRVMFVKKDNHQNTYAHSGGWGKSKGGDFKNNEKEQEFSSRRFREEAQKKKKEMFYRDEMLKQEDESRYSVNLERIAEIEKKHIQKWDD